ncbi:hypothetical protein SLE2022_022430 [Rubroshorea leprosula]
MFKGGNGMGGGGAGGGGMFRTVGRVATRARVATGKTTTNPESVSSSSCVSPTAASGDAAQKQSNQLFISASSHSFGGNVPRSSNPGVPSSWPAFVASPTSSCCDEFDWDAMDGVEDEMPLGFNDAIGPVPSPDEVQTAVSALQQVVDYPKLVRDKYSYNAGKDVVDPTPSPTGLLHRVSSVGSDIDWMEPSVHLYTSRVLHPYGSNRVYDAFHLLQTDPCIQKMVISLSSDKAVWDAVLNNEAVRELRKSYYAAEDSDDPNRAVNIVKSIFDNTKAKVMEVMEKITKIVNELFRPHPPEHEKAVAGTTDSFDNKLRTSFLLSVVVLLIVVVSRAHKA